MAKKKPSRPATKAAQKSGVASQLRIIGGQWRSRRLPVALVPGLRPTPGRVRETLFNWLQMKVLGARCLDLFAGSGALGFEALSREAAEVVMVEKHPVAYQQLEDNAATLAPGGESLQLLHTDGLAFLQTAPEPFDLIFLDPPFRKGLVDEVLNLIAQYDLLKTDGMIYLEHENGLEPDLTSHGLDIFRKTSAGQVISMLVH